MALSLLPKGFSCLPGFAITPCGLKFPRTRTGLAATTDAPPPAFATFAPPPPIGRRTFPPCPFNLAVCVARRFPAPVRNLPPLAVAPSPVPVIRPELSRVSLLRPRGAGLLAGRWRPVLPLEANRPLLSRLYVRRAMAKWAYLLASRFPWSALALFGRASPGDRLLIGHAEPLLKVGFSLGNVGANAGQSVICFLQSLL